MVEVGLTDLPKSGKGIAIAWLTVQNVKIVNSQINAYSQMKKVFKIELVSKELNHLAAILHVYAGGLNFMK